MTEFVDDGETLYSIGQADRCAFCGTVTRACFYNALTWCGCRYGSTPMQHPRDEYARRVSNMLATVPRVEREEEPSIIRLLHDALRERSEPGCGLRKIVVMVDDDADRVAALDWLDRRPSEPARAEEAKRDEVSERERELRCAASDALREAREHEAEAKALRGVYLEKDQMFARLEAAHERARQAEEERDNERRGFKAYREETKRIDAEHHESAVELFGENEKLRAELVKAQETSTEHAGRVFVLEGELAKAKAARDEDWRRAYNGPGIGGPKAPEELPRFIEARAALEKEENTRLAKELEAERESKSRDAAALDSAKQLFAQHCSHLEGSRASFARFVCGQLASLLQVPPPGEQSRG